ncbi:OadG family protein [Chloroflexota bacterium]
MMNPASISLSGAELVAKLSKDSLDWGDAWQVAGVGFGVVFLVLVILAVAIWVTGVIVKKLETRNATKETEQKKAS